MGKPGVGGDQGKIGEKVPYDPTTYIMLRNFLYLERGVISPVVLGCARGFLTRGN